MKVLVLIEYLTLQTIFFFLFFFLLADLTNKKTACNGNFTSVDYYILWDNDRVEQVNDYLSFPRIFTADYLSNNLRYPLRKF